jgi:uncharacterized phage infection (PIP) family protein YhgE
MKAPIGFIYPKDWQAPSCITVLVDTKTRDRLNDRFTSVAPELDTDEKINMLIDITEKADQSIDYFRSEYDSIKNENGSLKHQLKSVEEVSIKYSSECDNLKSNLDYARHQRNMAVAFMAISLLINIIAITSH